MNEFVEQALQQEEDTQKDRFLIFVLAKETFGIEIKFVSEIIGVQPITKVPKAPFFAKGIINLRGKIVPIIDMRLKFGKEPIEYDDRTCIIIVNILGMLAGLIVDCVEEVITIAEEKIVPPPDFKSGFQNRYINRIGMIDNEVKLLLDCDRLLKDDEFEEINQLQNF